MIKNVKALRLWREEGRKGHTEEIQSSFRESLCPHEYVKGVIHFPLQAAGAAPKYRWMRGKEWKLEAEIYVTCFIWFCNKTTLNHKNEMSVRASWYSEANSWKPISINYELHRPPFHWICRTFFFSQWHNCRLLPSFATLLVNHFLPESELFYLHSIITSPTLRSYCYILIERTNIKPLHSFIIHRKLPLTGW